MLLAESAVIVLVIPAASSHTPRASSNRLPVTSVSRFPCEIRPVSPALDDHSIFAADLRDLPFALLAECEQVAVDAVFAESLIGTLDRPWPRRSCATTRKPCCAGNNTHA